MPILITCCVITLVQILTLLYGIKEHTRLARYKSKAVPLYAMVALVGEEVLFLLIVHLGTR
jgi:hypothetical protein